VVLLLAVKEVGLSHAAMVLFIVPDDKFDHNGELRKNLWQVDWLDRLLRHYTPKDNCATTYCA